MKKGLLLSETEINDSINHLVRRTLERDKPAHKYTKKDTVSVKGASAAGGRLYALCNATEY